MKLAGYLLLLVLFLFASGSASANIILSAAPDVMVNFDGVYTASTGDLTIPIEASFALLLTYPEGIALSIYDPLTCPGLACSSGTFAVDTLHWNGATLNPAHMTVTGAVDLTGGTESGVLLAGDMTLLDYTPTGQFEFQVANVSGLLSSLYSTPVYILMDVGFSFNGFDHDFVTSGAVADIGLAAVPEPGTLWLIASAACLLWMRRRTSLQL